MQKYRINQNVVQNGTKFKAGEIVNEFQGCTYGCCSEWEIAVTKQGKEKFIGVDSRYLEEID